MSDPSSPPVPPGPAGAPGDRLPRRPPPRPAFSPAPPPPDTPADGRRPAALRASAWCWAGSFAAGALGLATALVNRDTIRARVTEAALETDPALAPDVLETGVTVTVDGMLGTAAGLVVVAALCLVLALRRTPGMRWVLAVAGVLTLFLLPLVLSLVAGGTTVDELSFLVQAALVVVALVTLFVGSSRSWLRGPRP
ncbi:hypothetical protein [Blastococcus saxobsidens]|uniref:Uncharacterized protein n=1 Tax=Blastococcus saxobsidens (strain DD2) TaxID=1146883 RepID=H6RJG5_BLASD|nr:hypothetical protein [Blastococcus saxobsidens]CCG01078.1 conserved membrane protein of unknown function [Blastococcus saxobsidens DD2]